MPITGLINTALARQRPRGTQTTQQQPGPPSSLLRLRARHGFEYSQPRRPPGLASWSPGA